MTSYYIHIFIFFLYYDSCFTQSIIWKSNNFKSCIKIGVDNFIMVAAVKKTAVGRNETFHVKMVLFEIKSSNSTEIKKCIVSFENCERPNDECYCADNTSDDIVIVYNIKANSSLIGSVVTVNIPCTKKEETFVSDKLVITSLNDTSPVLTMNKQEYELSKEFLHSHVPVNVEFCCDKNSSTHCKAHIMSNNEKIDNNSYCVSFNETSNRYINYKMYSTLCNQTIKIADMMFFPKIDKLDEESCAELWQVSLICAGEIIGAIIIAFFANNCCNRLFFHSKDKNDSKQQIILPKKRFEIEMDEVNSEMDEVNNEFDEVNSDGKITDRKETKRLIPSEDTEVFVNV